MNIKHINKILKLANLFVTASESYCEINLEGYSKKLKKYFMDLSDESIERFESAQNLDINSLIDELKKYTNDEELFAAIRAKRSDEVFNKLLKFKRDNYGVLPSSLYTKIIDYTSQYSYTEADAERDYNSILNKTTDNMTKICEFINAVIKRIDNYQGTQWRIVPSVHYNEYNRLAIEEPCDSATVISKNYNDVYFSLFALEEGLTPEDVIDDESDIEASGWQSDYYNLINEIRKPGSSSKGKIITLYTARPAKDRDFFNNTKALPNGIYLTNNLSSAEGLREELRFTDKTIRDLWKVRINNKYLLQTLDSPTEKQYRVLAGPDGAPIEGNMELLSYEE